VRIPVVLLLALALAPEAAAKCCALVTPVAPKGIAAGEEWRTVIDVQRIGYWRTTRTPTLIAWSEESRRLFSAEATRTSRPERFDVTVVFPEAGVWAYTVTFGGFAASAAAPVRRVTVAPRRAESALGAPYLPAAVGAILLAVLGLRPRNV
jgi:hypothetical protein